MKQAVKEAVDEYAIQKLSAQIKEIVKNEIVVFTVDKLKFHMGTRIDNLLAERDIAKASELSTLEISVKEVDAHHKELSNSITISANAAARKKQAMQADSPRS